MHFVGDLPLAVNDYGGSGTDVLLMHGGGRTHHDWDEFAGLLRDGGFRPVAMDLRGHGESGPGRWSWDAAVADAEAVVAELGLRTPVVAGHSLGGMVAAVWATRHSDCPLAINVDGHGNPTRTDQLLGLTGEDAEVALRRLRTDLDGMSKGMSPALIQMMEEVDALDLPAVYRRRRCPMLVVSGSLTAEFALLFDEPSASAWRAGRDGMQARLNELACESGTFTHESLETGHDAHREDPEGLALLLMDHPALSMTSGAR
ncbi:alpha/beta superfamily-like protein [Actinoplanes friuliensis DSM 7358]|uniref:Alpha/beta superfamily-like protein n=1 Tax=Actinoplanes friuliensis DSM 7358 TaxID=1246995 RepID=U5W4R1_9ACTN|nr:alpha/beta superfamily-like protein [Actinoplanes friuliensis DSM 7358]